MTDANGHQPGDLEQTIRAVLDQARTDRALDIPFGDLPSQVFTPEWAEGMLRELFDHHRETFGACLTAYTTGIRRAARGRKPAGDQQ